MKIIYGSCCRNKIAITYIQSKSFIVLTYFINYIMKQIQVCEQFNVSSHLRKHRQVLLNLYTRPKSNSQSFTQGNVTYGLKLGNIYVRMYKLTFAICYCQYVNKYRGMNGAFPQILTFTRNETSKYERQVILLTFD